MLSLINDVLYVALALSILTYYIGVLVLALPAPLAGIKRWAPLLIQDGALSAFLVMIFSVITDSIDYIHNLIGGSFDELKAFIMESYDKVFKYLLGLRAISSILGFSGLGVIAGVLGPLFSVVTLFISMLGIVMILASMITSLRDFLIAIGVMLYALPFRIGRTAGASLMAFTIVTYLGLPLLPLWTSLLINNMSSPINIENTVNEAVVLTGCINGDYGVPSSAVVVLKDKLTGTIYKSVTDVNGCFEIKGLRLQREYTVIVEYLGYELYVIPQSIIMDDNVVEDSTVVRLDLYTPSIVYPWVGTFIYISDCDEKVVNVNDGTVELACRSNPYEWMEITLAYISDCTESVMLQGFEIVNKTTNTTQWLNYEVTSIEISGYSQGDEYIIKLNLSNCTTSIDNLNEINAFDSTENMDLVVQMLVSLIWYWLSMSVSISSYLALLAMLSYGLTRMLGGHYIRLPVSM